MTFEEALEALSEGKKVGHKDWSPNVYLKKYFDRVVNQDNKTMSLTITDMLSDDWEEYKEPILDEEEKKYLSNVLKPYGNRVGVIMKTGIDGVYERLIISVHSECCTYNNYIMLPYFYKGEMYKGMEDNKQYTLKDLGL